MALAWETHRLGASQDLTVASAGGAAVSTTLFGTQTYWVRLVTTNVASTFGSTSGVRIAVGNASEAPVASSTSGTQLITGTVEVIKVTPGQRISVIAADLGTYRLNVTELSN